MTIVSRRSSKEGTNMWLRNIFTKTLRDLRTGVIGWGLGLAVLLVVGATQYHDLIGGIGPERQRLI